MEGVEGSGEKFKGERLSDFCLRKSAGPAGNKKMFLSWKAGKLESAPKGRERSAENANLKRKIGLDWIYQSFSCLTKGGYFFHLIPQPMPGFWGCGTFLLFKTESKASLKSLPFAGIPLPGRDSSSCPR